MDIAHLDPPAADHQGDYHYRTSQPCRALGERPGVRIVSGCWLTKSMRSLCDDADVLVLNKVVDFDLLPLIARRRRRGLATIYEINDDFAALEAEHPTYTFFSSPAHRSLCTQLARHADGLQFSSQGLKRTYGHLNSRQRVFMNHLFELPAATPRRPSDRLTVGWAGSAGHLADIAAVLPALSRLIAEQPHVDLAVMGSEAVHQLFADLPQHRCRLQPTGSLEAYFAFLRTLDIGIAPLRDTGFNRGRSDIKFVEYAACGVAALCSGLGPYPGNVEHGVTGFLVYPTEDWYGALKTLVNDTSLRTQVATQAHAWAGRERRERDHADERLAFYRECSMAVRQVASDNAANDARRQRFSAVWSSEERPYHDSSYAPIPLCNADKHLYNGLLQQADAPLAQQEYARAAELDNDNYLVHLYRGASAQHFESPLARAQTLAPESPAVTYVLAQRRATQGDLAGAAQALRQTVESAPAHAPARTVLSSIQEHEGDHRSAAAGYRQALADNPDYYPAAIQLANLLTTFGQTADALAALRAVETLASHDAGYWLQRAKVELKRGARAEALASLEYTRRLDANGPAAGLIAKLASA